MIHCFSAPISRILTAKSVWLAMAFVFANPPQIAQSEPLILVTPAEAAQSATAQSPLVTRALPDPLAPRIIIDVPTPGRSVQSPTSIRLRFEAASGATVIPTTLQVRYGALGLDITSRVLARYKPTSEGLAVDEAVIPNGRHVFTVSIEDNFGRLGRRRMEIAITSDTGESNR